MTGGELVVHLEQRGCRVRIRQSGTGWMAQCPAHRGGRKPSLAISIGAEGRYLLHCFSGCTFEDVRAALQLPREAFSGWASYRRRGGSLPVSTNAHSPGGHELGGLLAKFDALELLPARVQIVLPNRAGRVVRVVARDLELLTGLRLAVDGSRTLPYASAWAAERLAEDRSNVRRAIGWLVAHDVLERRGKLQARESQAGTRLSGTQLYRVARGVIA
jgi:hypothetical protein